MNTNMRLPPDFRPRSPAGALGTGAPAPHAPAPPPPVAVVAAPPPPAANVARDVATPEDYQARDPSFYYDARCRFAAALQPFGFDQNECEQAEKTAHLCAIFLDCGAAPQGFMVPSVARRWFVMLEKEVLEATLANKPLSYGTQGASAHAGERNKAWPEGQPVVPRGPVPAPSMTEGEKAASQTRINNYTKEHGLPTREEATARNDAAIAAVKDISERIRYAALENSIARIVAAGNNVTGARPTEALQIVAYEVDRAYRFAVASNGLIPTKSFANMSDEEAMSFGANTLPYPADKALSIMMANIIAPPEEQGAPDEPNEGIAAPHGAP